jgi:hypothetical protein
VLLATLLALLMALPSAAQAPTPVTDPQSGFMAWHEMDHIPGEHIEGVLLYAQIPPVGGPHNPVWQDCGFYTQPIYSWHGVHSLEHGAVWITYDPALPADQVARLQPYVDLGHVIVSPYPGLTDPVVASAWGRQVRLTGVDDPRLEQFVTAYRISPENAPEPGAACEGGTTATLVPGDTLQTEPSIVSGTPDQVAAARSSQPPAPATDVDLRNAFNDRD